MQISTTAARDRLPDLILRVQEPQSFCVLTRHGKAVAALVSMAELKRIWSDQDISDVISGKRIPSSFIFGRGGHDTNAQAAAAILKMQLDRRMEREVLKHAGKAPVPGGELAAEAELPPAPATRRRWWKWR